MNTKTHDNGADKHEYNPKFFYSLKFWEVGKNWDQEVDKIWDYIREIPGAI
jgi:hypothetical protein